jgi:DNA-binding NtrC family response regulator
MMTKMNERYDELSMVKESLKTKQAMGRILGKSSIMDEIHRQIGCISACDVNVLISGESGSGKELVARSIHYLSHRAAKPFIPVNCGAIPETLFENELFGHVKGAFTDAGYKQNGLVKEADGGTLFLDEIGVISPYIQVKLLRLLQDNEYKPLGDSLNRQADLRMIAATNEDLVDMTKKGDFREDLYYRLNIVSLHIPPLRERKEDIPLLVDHFIKKYAAIYDKPVHMVSTEAMEQLLLYNWPGNVRELENSIQQALVMATDGVLTGRDLHMPSGQVKPGGYKFENFKRARKEMLDNFEKEYLVRLLTKFNGNVVNAAAGAGRSRTAIWNLLTRHRLHPSQFIRI